MLTVLAIFSVLAIPGTSCASDALEKWACAQGYGAIADQVADRQTSDALSGNIEMFSRYPRVTRSLLQEREARLQSDREVRAMIDNDPAGYENGFMIYNIEPVYNFENPMSPYDHPTQRFQEIFGLLSICDRTYGFAPTLSDLAKPPLPAAQKTPVAVKPAPSHKSYRDHETASNEICGGYYVLTSNLFANTNEQLGREYHGRMLNLVKKAGNNSPDVYGKIAQDYNLTARRYASEFEAGMLSVPILESKLRMCDTEFGFQSLDMRPYY